MKGLFLGLATIDVIHYTGTPPGENEKTAADETRIYTGGPAANAAVTFAKLGGSARLIAPVGRHPAAEIIRRELSSYQVDLEDTDPESDLPPVTASVVVNTRTGNRSVIGVKPASRNTPLQPGAGEDLPDVILTDTYYLETARPFFELAAQQNIPVVLDGGSWKPSLEGILPFVDYALCSEQFRAPGASSMEETAAFLYEAGAGQVCFTRGAQPLICCHQDGGIQEFPVPQVSRVQDTLAAGDIFHGACCYALAAKTRDLEAVLSFAASAAAQSVQVLGPRDWQLEA